MTVAAATDPATKARALQLAREHGPAEAARQTGIKASTIRSWRRRAGESGPPAGADPEDWAASKRAAAEEAHEASRQALRSVDRWLKDGSPHKAQAAATAAGILVDKANVLEAQALTVENRSIRLTEAQAQIIATVLKATVRELGIPQGKAVNALFRTVIMVATAEERSIAEGHEKEPPEPIKFDEAPAARRELRGALRAELEAEIRSDIEQSIRAEVLGELEAAERERQEAEQRRREETPQLPAPDPDSEPEEPDAWAGPVRHVTTVPPDDQVIDATAEEVPHEQRVSFTGRRGRVSRHRLDGPRVPLPTP